jgi:peptidyl-prolyl cis-trans isomerase B (cyclophilin B)
MKALSAIRSFDEGIELSCRNSSRCGSLDDSRLDEVRVKSGSRLNPAFTIANTIKFYHGETKEMSNQQWDSAPKMQIDTASTCNVTIETNRGSIELELNPQHAPQTVNNFVFLAGQGFYDGVAFHRVIPSFMVQGGDPTGSGAGGPGYRFDCETDGNPLVHERGVISMANAGANTNGSQFFITHVPCPHLNGKHTVFGKVTKGLDVVDAIQQDDQMVKVTVAS